VDRPGENRIYFRSFQSCRRGRQRFELSNLRGVEWTKAGKMDKQESNDS
jgi:hypothetical protein